MSSEEINLFCSNGTKFTVSTKVAKLSKLITNVWDEEDNNDDDVVMEDRDFHCLKVSTPTLSKVVEFCTHYQTVEKMNAIITPLKGKTLKEIVKQDWYVNFCDVEIEMLRNLVSAANYMDITPLLELACLTLSIGIKGKSKKELRAIFNIPEPNPTEAEDSDKDGDAKKSE